MNSSSVSDGLGPQASDVGGGDLDAGVIMLASPESVSDGSESVSDGLLPSS